MDTKLTGTDFRSGDRLVKQTRDFAFDEIGTFFDNDIARAGHYAMVYTETLPAKLQGNEVSKEDPPIRVFFGLR
ncbi:MAG: hypothetical protein MJA83_15815 [Gammaproteobacteria bacterium]|nr:hypothetical protein [Gammaproteobacteria bacterium]